MAYDMEFKWYPETMTIKQIISDNGTTIKEADVDPLEVARLGDPVIYDVIDWAEENHPTLFEGAKDWDFHQAREAYGMMKRMARAVQAYKYYKRPDEGENDAD